MGSKLQDLAGYVIIETATVTNTREQNVNIVKDNGRRVFAEVILQDMDVLNRNGRYYASSELIPQLTCERITELLRTGNMYGEEGHPLAKDILRQQVIEPERRCHLITKLWHDGKDIKAIVRGSNTKHGEAFDLDLRDGTYPSFSLRALGTIANTKRGMEVRNMTVITWDRVIFPSHKRAYTEKIVSVGESACLTNQQSVTESRILVPDNDEGIMIPIINEQVLDYIKEKSNNIHNFRESFDIFGNSVSLCENGRQVQMLSKEGDIFIVNLEHHCQDIVMNYCASNASKNIIY